MNIVLIIILLCAAYGYDACADNCMAYRSKINYSTNNYNFFYLWYYPSEGKCTHCYFNINTYDNHQFKLGIYNWTTYTLYVAIYGDQSTSSGFSTCQPGFCAIWFDNEFISFDLQMADAEETNKCVYSNSYCSGTVDSQINRGITYPKTTNLNCSLS